MPESQFGPAASLSATLDELVALARHLRATPADISSRLTRLEGLSKLLHYFSSPPEVAGSVIVSSQSPISAQTHCAFHDCSRTWRDFDACLLNFAKAGESPLWLCREHHPPLSDGGVRPPGWQSDDATREAAELARREALAALSREQLRLVNARVGG